MLTPQQVLEGYFQELAQDPDTVSFVGPMQMQLSALRGQGGEAADQEVLNLIDKLCLAYARVRIGGGMYVAIEAALEQARG
jgi:hypothetical protein